MRTTVAPAEAGVQFRLLDSGFCRNDEFYPEAGIASETVRRLPSLYKSQLTPAGLEDNPSVLVSAAKGWNLDSLLEEIEAQLMDIDGPMTVATSAAGD